MVKGLDRFTEHFEEFRDAYVLIGGAACDLWLTDHALPFRRTKDLDLVLLVEALTPAFFDRFWEFIQQGAYESRGETDRLLKLYRFFGPRDPEFPYMIELLTRNLLNLPPGVTLTPIPAGDEASSLSAILMDEDYYRFVLASRIVIDRTPIVSAIHGHSSPVKMARLRARIMFVLLPVRTTSHPPAPRKSRSAAWARPSRAGADGPSRPRGSA